jgi:hypothetical protein
MARQVGTVLGVAGLVAILTHLDRSDPVATYQHGVVLIIAFFASAGLVAAALLTARVSGPAAPARPAREAPAVQAAWRPGPILTRAKPPSSWPAPSPAAAPMPSGRRSGSWTWRAG